MKYEKPIAQIIVFDNSDVITASGPCGAKGQTKGQGCVNSGVDWKKNSDPASNDAMDSYFWFK